LRLTNARSKAIPKLKLSFEVTKGLESSRNLVSVFITTTAIRLNYSTISGYGEIRPVKARAEPKITGEREGKMREILGFLQFLLEEGVY
jgi:hypothetical protein